jgi:hypothetical protein
MLEPKAVTPAKKFKLPAHLTGALLGGALAGPFSNAAVIFGASAGFTIGKKLEKRKQKQREESFKTINLLKPKIKNTENLRQRFKNSILAKKVFLKRERAGEVKSKSNFWESELAKNHVKHF